VLYDERSKNVLYDERPKIWGNLFSIIIIVALLALIGINPSDEIYRLDFSEIDKIKIEKLDLKNIKVIEEKIIDKDHCAFIYTDDTNGGYKGAIQVNGESYYIGQVSMENTPDHLMGIEETQVFEKKAVKFYGILGANYVHSVYWLVAEKTEDAIFQIEGNTLETDLDDDGKIEIIATTGTIPETRVYVLKDGKIVVANINESMGAKSVSYDESYKLFEVYFDTNQLELYVYQNESLIVRK
jgi:hypothetical protein